MSEFTPFDDGDSVAVTLKRTTLIREVSSRTGQAINISNTIPEESLPEVGAFLPPLLHGAIFCGHLVTDLDSIAGAIGAAELYSGIAARASEVNSETAFALNLWSCEKPAPIEELLITYPDRGVCLVDPST